MMAVFTGDETAAAAVTVAVCGGRGAGRSRRAVRWAAEHLVPHAHRVVLVHVIRAVTSIPSPSGERVPVDRLGKDVVEMYVQDLKSKAQQVLFPFRELCGTRNVETLVLEGENPAAALLEYVSISGTKNLVLGYSSFRFRRILKGPDVPTTVLKFSPDYCNIFAVSRRKLIMKFANQVSDDPSISTHIQTIKGKLFVQRRGTLHSRALSEPSSSISVRSFETLPSIGGHEEGELNNKNYGFLASIKYKSSFMFHSSRKNLQDVSPAEVSNSRKESQNILAMYDQVCDDLVHAKKKFQSLSSEYSEVEKKLKNGLEREKVLEAIKEVEEAKQVSVKEAQHRHKAELVRISSELSKTIDGYFLNSKWCRRYSKNEIEVATDNFSEAKKIGEGGCGYVYKCNLDHTLVAVKVLRQDARDKEAEFLREVKILSQIHHPHLVLLLGVCLESGCLVYEYMENGSLDDHLFNRDGKRPLPWIIRFRILYEVACGLTFLHGNKPEPIVHRDLKPANILLNRNYVSKIGDVGLAKLLSDVVPDGLTEYRETILAGTFFYMDPEYQRTGTVRPKSDLYAWGVIALQLLTGKNPNGLIVSMENAIRGGTFSAVLDQSVKDWPLAEAERLAKLALQCSRLTCRERPDLDSEVLPELEDILNKGNAIINLKKHNIDAPKHYFCPILMEIMDDPYVAADGYTYEHKAIRAWLEKYDTSPVNKIRLPHTSIIPNHSLRLAIQEWKSHVAFSTSWN
ncbi:U-box domain-containing protein 34 isoform X1 [Musa acuminata AAA Group]|uniref:U-box domain-containing protein 34 isoform X1 n=1 Tax=Musa acuminata AAA Group TaxID=214697 RepID=UPI0031E10987